MTYPKHGPNGLNMTQRFKSRPSSATKSEAWPARSAILIWSAASGVVWLALVASAVVFI